MKICLENNRSVAEHRLKLLKKRLLKDAELLTKYRENVESLLKEGFLATKKLHVIQMLWLLIENADSRYETEMKKKLLPSWGEFFVT